MVGEEASFSIPHDDKYDEEPDGEKIGRGLGYSAELIAWLL